MIIIYFFKILFFVFQQNAAEAKNVFTPSGIDMAIDSAQVKHKIIMAHCTAEWCLPCKQMEKYTFTDERFYNYATKKLICIKLDATNFDDINVINAYQVNKYPTVLFLNESGKEISRLVGFQSAKSLMIHSEKIYQKLYPKKVAAPVLKR